MTTEHIRTELADRVLTIRFNRPDKKNSVTQAMYAAMADALAAAETNNDVRVVLFAGQPDCFCAGNDVQDFLQMPPASADSPVARFMRAVATCKKPMVAAPAGIAVGIGVTLLLHCDLVYCGEQTRLNMPFVNLGICPELASTYLLPRLMGHQRACELVLLGKPFDAQTARDYGIVNAVVPNAGVEARAREAALAIAALPPNSVRTTKALLKRWSEKTALEAIDAEIQHFVPMLKQGEALEAMTAFMQKRKPDFSRFA
jgi:enoyl-CoA hydratase/carnithine racemase